MACLRNSESDITDSKLDIENVLTPAVSNDSSKIIYGEEEIKRLLDFYKEEYIYLTSVELINGKFNFTFRKFEYPYFKSEVKHLTREQTIAFVTQSAYLFGIINSIYDKNWDYPIDKFHNYAKNEKMGFFDISIKYNKFTDNKDNTLLIFNKISYRKLNGKIFGQINFELESHCTGILKFFIEE